MSKPPSARQFHVTPPRLFKKMACDAADLRRGDQSVIQAPAFFGFLERPEDIIASWP